MTKNESVVEIKAAGLNSIEVTRVITPEILAAEIVRVIKEWLEPSQLELISAGSHEPDNFIDSNMAVSRAVENLTGLTEDEVCNQACSQAQADLSDSTPLLDLWNAAVVMVLPLLRATS
jgi:hypothetical protein